MFDVYCENVQKNARALLPRGGRSTAMPFEVRETDAADALLETLLAEHAARHAAAPARAAALPTLLARIAQHHALGAKQHAISPFERMQHARDALAYLDTVGWKRSYHQRMFHEDFLVSLELVYV